MKQETPPRVGFVCAYTPLVLIHAAGFDHYRILPMGEWPDQAGHLLHDNLCPHVKRILDRALDKDLPALAGMIFVNSCDAMRRAADAWHSLRREEPVFIIDMPATQDESAVGFLAGEFARLADHLHGWGGNALQPRHIEKSTPVYNRVAALLGELADRARYKRLKGGHPRLQELYNLAATHGLDSTLHALESEITVSDPEDSPEEGVPVYLFGNVLADPHVYSLLASCGADVVGDDFCTGTRMFSPIGTADTGDVYTKLAESILSKPPCPRTFDGSRPGGMAQDILARAKACSARGVIGHTLKFCDPYLARLPHVRDVFRKEGLALLLLEGDCTLRSLGQQQTRIEAFIEMLR